MDAPRLTFACGHSAEGRHFRGDAEARRRQLEAYKKKLPSLLCRECFRTSKGAENAKAADANRSAGLPKLIGTANEVQWAEQLRFEFHAALLAKGCSKEEARQFASACQDAVTWIGLRKLDAPALLDEFIRWDRVAEANEEAGLPELTSLGFCHPQEVRAIEDVRRALLEVFAEAGASTADAAAVVSLVTDVGHWQDLAELELTDLVGVLVDQAAGGTAVDDYLRARHEERARQEQALLAGVAQQEDADPDA
jgi:hypothetical protein